MATKIQLRRDSTANWTTADPTLASGEIGFETDSGKIKLGDGTSVWTALAYLAGDLPANAALLDAVQSWTRQQNFTATNLTSGAAIAWDLDLNQVATVVLDQNAALANPANARNGGTYIVIVKQDATGSRTLTFGTSYKFPGGTAPVLSTAANAVDVLTFIADTVAGAMYCVAQNDFK